MIPKGKGLPCYADDSTLNQIRGKAMVGHQSIEDVWTLLDLGPSGWREFAEAESRKFRKGER